MGSNGSRGSAARVEVVAQAESALEAARGDEKKNLVVEAFVFAVKDGPHGPVADHIRDAIRAAGPTVRRDLGKQAAR